MFKNPWLKLSESTGLWFIGKLSVINRGEYKQSVWDKLYRVNINHLGDTSE